MNDGSKTAKPARKSNRPQPARKRKPSAYELRALKAIHAWKQPRIGWFGRTVRTLSWPLSKAQDGIKRLPGYDKAASYGKPAMDWVLEKSAGGLIHLVNGAAQWSVRPQAIYAEFKSEGHSVNESSDILKLDLEAIDKTIGWLNLKYESLCAVEGGATGAAGLPGIPADIVALIGLNLRAIGEYATYCNFDVSKQEERLFALNILSLASSPADASKQLALAQLIRIAKDVAAKKTWNELNKHSLVPVIRKVCEALAERLTKAKLAQMIPYLGGGIGAGFNAYYTSKVCEAAANLYRERFLAAKYGPEFIEETVAPAKQFSGAPQTFAAAPDGE